MLDPDELRAFAARDWSTQSRLSRASRAKLSVDEKVRLAVELYEAARRQNPGWPDAEVRASDHAMHQRLRAMLDAAPHVGAPSVGKGNGKE